MKSQPHHAGDALPADPVALLEAVLETNRRTENPRLKAILESAIRHLHAFAQDSGLSMEELELGIDFLVNIGKATGPEKNEGILLADILGLSTLVGLIDAKSALALGGTEPALVGPFWRANQPTMPSGALICSADTAGSRLFVNGRVVSLESGPIKGARVETWQAAPSGLYENQDKAQPDMNLRACFETDGEGRFSFQSVRPAGYSVPTDGPCGDLLRLQGRPVMRPAHLHFLVFAAGHKTLATQIFDAEDPNAFCDAAFGAVGSLLQSFEPQADGTYQLDVELRLEPGEMRIPYCPLP